MSLARPAIPALAAAVAALPLAGCGSGDNGGAIVIPGSTLPSVTSTTAGGIDTMEGASTVPVSVPVSKERGLLTAVRVARQEGYDRVVFEFEGAVPGYSVSYVQKPLHADASGAEVAIAGTYAVQVRMELAGAADLSGAKLRITYHGPDRIEPGTPEVAEVVKTGDFEGVLTWAIGTVDKVDFRVSTLTSPGRIVVDLRNH